MVLPEAWQGILSMLRAAVALSAETHRANSLT